MTFPYFSDSFEMLNCYASHFEDLAGHGAVSFLFGGACFRLEEMEKHEIRGPPRGIRTAPLIQLTRALCRHLLPFCKMRRTGGLNPFGAISGTKDLCYFSLEMDGRDSPGNPASSAWVVPS